MCDYLRQNWQDLLSGIGLLMTFIGAAMTAWPMRVSQADAGDLATPRWAYKTAEENAKLPLAISLLRNSKGAMRGLYLIAVGSLFQLVPIAFRILQ